MSEKRIIANAGNTTLSNIGDGYDGLGGPALVAMLTAIDATCGGTAGAIGTLLSYASSMRGKAKNDIFAHSIIERLNKLETHSLHVSEDLEEAVLIAIDGVQRAVTEAQIQRFAKIISGHIIGTSGWDETATALRTLSGLEDIHIQILNEASIHGQKADGRFGFYIKDEDFPRPGMKSGTAPKVEFNILEVMPHRDKREIMLFSVELVGKGLLNDGDQGQIGTGQVFTLTEAAIWFLAKIELMAKKS